MYAQPHGVSTGLDTIMHNLKVISGCCIHVCTHKGNMAQYLVHIKYVIPFESLQSHVYAV